MTHAARFDTDRPLPGILGALIQGAAPKSAGAKAPAGNPGFKLSPYIIRSYDTCPKRLKIFYPKASKMGKVGTVFAYL
jgi:hypothetical protein